MDPARSTTSIVLFCLLILAGGYFAGAEIALASVNKIRIAGQVDDGDKKAKRVQYILDNFNKALTTLLIGNNIAHIGCSAIATTMTYQLLQQHTDWPSWIQTVSTLLTTVIVFQFSEMIPKCFAKDCNEAFAKNIAGSLIFLMKVLTPISFLFTLLGDLLSRPFLKKATVQPTVTEEELHDIIETVVQEGEIDEDTGDLIQSVLEFTDSVVHEVFTPMSDVTTICNDMTPDQIIAAIRETPFTRLPVTDPNGKVVGILHIRNYLRAYLKDGAPELQPLISAPHFVQQGKAVDELLESMSQHRVHLAVVLDNKGKALGIITIEDILEELVGEIYDEEDIKGGVGV